MGDDAHAPGSGGHPRLEHAFALVERHGGAFARRSADEDAVGSVGREFVGIGPNAFEVHVAFFIEGGEYGGNESGQSVHGKGMIGF